ncbi:MAG: TonB family protein, partial [Desulfovibrionaceae bacterium]
ALMDKSACAAVMSAGKFGNPPYGLPMDVFLTFWTGLPRVAGTSAGSVPSADTTNTVAQQKADAATAAAVALAKAAEARAASATAKPGQGAHSASPAASPTPASPAPATSTVKTDTAGGRVVAPPSADALALRDPKNREPLVGPAGEIANPEESRYAKKVASTIRQHMVIPAELPRGLYTFKMLVHLSPTGEITQANITQSSGEAPMDKYALRATKRAQKVAPPPSKKLQDLHLTFVVQRP